MEPLEGETKKNVLMIKNLPKQIDDLAALLRTPAEEIKSFGRRRALLQYSSEAEAETALNDLEERGFTVAKFTPHKHENGENVWKNKPQKPKQMKKLLKKDAENDEKNLEEDMNELSGENQLDFQSSQPPYLDNEYPSINGDILNGICQALLHNKQFYTKVLHLMKRMNLELPFSTNCEPPGFTQNTCTTETSEPQLSIICQKIQKPISEEAIAEEEEEETELESSEDERERKSNEQANRPLKRKSNISNADEYKKKARKLLEQTKKNSKFQTNLDKTVLNKLNIAEVFEDFRNKRPAKIELKLKSQRTENAENSVKSCFEPPAELSSYQMPIEELDILPIYKNYSLGEPSNKLYIKNLAKQVTSDDLLAIYKRFLSPEYLEIKVMQQGRMKGQAFVAFNGLSKFDTQKVVLKALQSTHGFILYEKPMIVCYGKQS